MPLHCPLRHDQRLCHFSVGCALGDQAESLDLSGSERVAGGRHHVRTLDESDEHAIDETRLNSARAREAKHRNDRLTLGEEEPR